MEASIQSPTSSQCGLKRGSPKNTGAIVFRNQEENTKPVKETEVRSVKVVHEEDGHNVVSDEGYVSVRRR